MGILQYRKLGLGLGALALLAGLRAEEVVLEAHSRGTQKMDIAVLQFSPAKEKEKRRPHVLPDGILENDLLLSGRFNVLRTLEYDSTLLLGKQIPVYVQGNYAFKGDHIRLVFGLYDSRTRELIAGKKYTAEEKHLRTITHKFSDEIVMSLFGEKGISQTRIAFVRKGGKGKEVFLMDYDGHHAQAATQNGSINLFPSWSPDNKRIVYVSYKSGRPRMYVSWLHSRKVQMVAGGQGLYTSPEWNRINDQIVYASSTSGNTEIYISEPNGSGKIRVSHHRAIDTSPTWSPNGYELAFTSDRKGSPQIYVMDVEGANVRRMTFKGKYNDSPVWSPRGDRIAYASLEGNQFNIYTMNVEGEDVRQLTLGPGNNEYPSWSPDGRLIAFARSRRGKSDIFLMNEDGSEQRQITFSGDCQMPCWSNF